MFVEYANRALRDVNLHKSKEARREKNNKSIQQEINVLLIMVKTMYDKANFAPFHKKWAQDNRISWGKLCSLIYHEISFPTVTAAVPWDSTWCFDLFSYFNHSIGKTVSCPQHYANIYLGLNYPCVYSKFTEVKWESVQALPPFYLFTVNFFLK